MTIENAIKDIITRFGEYQEHCDEITVPGTIVKHFKKDACVAMSDPNLYLYKVIGVCTHTETRETLVCYQALYGDQKIYVRPYDMFTSLVDKKKYPEAKQKWRLEKVETAGTFYDTGRLKEGC